MMRFSVICGTLSANCHATAPPQSCPTMVALSLPEVLDHRRDVADQQAHVVVLDALRLVAQVVAALIDGDHLVLVGQPFHLVAPRVPEVGEAVDHHHQRTLAEGGVVDLHPAFGRGVAVLDAVVEVGVGGARGHGDGEADGERAGEDGRQSEL